jgi:hypothetical protein
VSFAVRNRGKTLPRCPCGLPCAECAGVILTTFNGWADASKRKQDGRGKKNLGSKREVHCCIAVMNLRGMARGDMCGAGVRKIEMREGGKRTTRSSPKSTWLSSDSFSPSYSIRVTCFGSHRLHVRGYSARFNSFDCSQPRQGNKVQISKECKIKRLKRFSTFEGGGGCL